MNTPKTVNVENNSELIIDTEYEIGSIVMFEYDRKVLSEGIAEKERRVSYSKIVKIVPKVEQKFYESIVKELNIVKLYYVMENNKFIPQEDIKEVIKKKV